MPKADTQLARILGDNGDAVVYFIEDSHGDLVDLQYRCLDCFEDSFGNRNPDYWPCWDFGDNDAYCNTCDRRIHHAQG